MNKLPFIKLSFAPIVALVMCVVIAIRKYWIKENCKCYSDDAVAESTN